MPPHRRHNLLYTTLRTMPVETKPLSDWYGASSSSSSSTIATTTAEAPKQKQLLRYHAPMTSLDGAIETGEQAEVLRQEAGPLTAGVQSGPVTATRSNTNNSHACCISDNSSHPDDEERQAQFPIGTQVSMVCFRSLTVCWLAGVFFLHWHASGPNGCQNPVVIFRIRSKHVVPGTFYDRNFESRYLSGVVLEICLEMSAMPVQTLICVIFTVRLVGSSKCRLTRLTFRLFS